MEFVSLRKLLRKSYARRKYRRLDWRPKIKSRMAFFERLEERALLAPISGINPAGGSWRVGANWSGGIVPGANDDVTIDLPGSLTITHSTGTDTIKSLTSQESLTLSGGTLTVTGTVQGSGSITMSGGTLGSATVQQLIKGTTSGGTLNNVKLQGDVTQPVLLDLNGFNVNVGVTGDLTLDNATARLQNWGEVFFNSAAATLGGTGTVLFADNNGSSGLRPVANAGQLTIGAGITVKGSGGTIGYISQWGGPTNVTVVNQGTIGPTQAGTIYITGAALTNNGTLQASGTGTLIVQPTTITNFSASTLTGGTWKAFDASTLRAILPASITTNAANIVLDGPNATFYRDTGSTHALALLTTNLATGSFTLQNGAQFATAGDFTNAGTLTVGTGSTFALTGALTQTGGNINLQGGTIGNQQPPSSNAMNFDGSNDFLEVADSPTLHTAGELTVSGWFKSDGFQRQWQNIFFKGNLPDGGNSENREYGLWLNSSGYLYFGSTPVSRIGVGSLDLNTAAGSIKAGKWYHFAAEISTVGNFMRVYVNGQLAAERTYDASGIRDTTGPFRIGQSPPWDSYFNGQIDEVAVWNVARTPAAIQSDMYRQLSGTEPNLNALWRFEDSGSTTQDLTGHGNTGYLGSIVANQPAWSPRAGLSFDGFNDLVEAPDAASLDLTTAFTLEAWIDPRTISGRDRGIISKVGGVNGNNGYQFAVTSDSRLKLMFNAPGESWPFNVVQTAPLDLLGQWHHVAGTYDHNTLRIYLDGALVATQVVGAKTVVNSSSSLRLGVDDNNGIYFDGQMSDARVWNVARTQAEIQAGMNSPLTGNEAGLVGLWRLNDTAGVKATDASGHGNDGELGTAGANRPAWVNPGPGLAFDGTNDFVEAPSSANLNPTTAITLAAWVKPTATSSNFPNILSKTSNSSFNQGYTLGIQGNQIYGEVPTTTGDIFLQTSANVVTLNEWQYISLTYDSAAGTLRLYRNAVLVQEWTGLSGQIVSADFPLTIGAINRGGSFTNPFQGQMHDVSVWNVARSQAQLQAQMNSGLTGNEAGLAGLWRFDEGAGFTAADASGHGNNVGLGSVASARPLWVTPGAGSGLLFDGANDYVEAASSASLKVQNAISLSAWIKPLTTNSNFPAILAKESNTFGNESYVFGIRNNHLYAEITTTTGNLYRETSTNVVTLNDWQYISMTYDSAVNALRLYRNGVLVQEFTDVSGTIVEGDNPVSIGMIDSFGTLNNPFSGQIRDVSVWSLARSQTEIQAALTAGLTGSETGLVSLWRLDEGAGLNAADASGHGNVAILGGTPSWQPARAPLAALPPVNTSLAFDGADDLVRVGNLGARPTQGTIAFWIDPASVDDFRGVLTTGPLPSSQFDGNRAIRFEQNAAGTLFAIIGNDTAGSSGTTAHTLTTDLRSGTWAHVALNWDSATNRVQGFVNGQLAFDEANTTWPTNFTDVYFGGGYATSNPNNRFYKGKLAGVEFWNKALNASQVQSAIQPRPGNQPGQPRYLARD
jgi:hypothetical protein